MGLLGDIGHAVTGTVSAVVSTVMAPVNAGISIARGNNVFGAVGGGIAQTIAGATGGVTSLVRPLTPTLSKVPLVGAPATQFVNATADINAAPLSAPSSGATLNTIRPYAYGVGAVLGAEAAAPTLEGLTTGQLLGGAGAVGIGSKLLNGQSPTLGDLSVAVGGPDLSGTGLDNVPIAVDGGSPTQPSTPLGSPGTPGGVRAGPGGFVGPQLPPNVSTATSPNFAVLGLLGLGGYYLIKKVH